MNYNNNNEENFDINELREELLAVQASNVALAAIIASLPETARLDLETVSSTCAMMCEMDAHTEMATSQFAAGILSVARELNKQED